MKEPELKVTVLDVDYEALLVRFITGVIMDEPYSFECFNIYITKLLESTLEDSDLDLEDKELLDHILSKVDNPEGVLSLTTTSLPGRVVHYKEESYSVPLILQVEAFD